MIIIVLTEFSIICKFGFLSHEIVDNLKFLYILMLQLMYML